MIFFDTETCGLHSVPVLLQFAEGSGPINLYDLWLEEISETMELIEYFTTQDVCGFNLAFDWFQLNKFYNMISVIEDRTLAPIEIIDELYQKELDNMARYCIKPKRACDLMLHAKKGDYQCIMDRKPITLRRVPASIAPHLVAELDERIKIPEIYFAKRKQTNRTRWAIKDIVDKETGRINPDFKDLELSFAPSTSLKALTQEVIGKTAEEVIKFDEVGLSERLFPTEYGYAPYGKAYPAVAWPKVIKFHVDHWAYNKKARQYAEDDVTNTRTLYEKFGSPEPGDDDSELACMVASVRLRGFNVDLDQMKELQKKAEEAQKDAPLAPSKVKEWIFPDLTDDEKLGTGYSTRKEVLKEMTNWTIDCPECDGRGCEDCEGSGEVIHPAAIKAKRVNTARAAQKENELYSKILLAKRFYASFKVIGAKSSRMSGDNSLNAQGIKRTKDVRRCFLLADPGFVLSGGDFDAFEVSICDAAYPDSRLHEALLNDKKIHALFAMALWPDMSYDEICATSGTDDDRYTKGKSGVFSQMYFGNYHTLMTRLGIPEEQARNGEMLWKDTYKEMAESQQAVIDRFTCVEQPKGIGTQVVWKDPDTHVESLLGFSRDFTIEVQICRVLYELASKPPKVWSQYKRQVWRRDRVQTESGAVMSALYAAIFGLQGVIIRAAGNHIIQSTGAEITKRVQRRIWDLQPCGVQQWHVMPMNVHDEVMCVSTPEMVEPVAKVVNETVESFRNVVPLIKMTWKSNLSSWADKG